MHAQQEDPLPGVEVLFEMCLGEYAHKSEASIESCELSISYIRVYYLYTILILRACTY